jgi:tetratricopeptide (TPR) repeat protein
MKPDNALTLNRRADAYVALGQFAKAVGDLDAALKLKPDDFDTTQRMAYVKAKLASPRLQPAAAAYVPPKPPESPGMSMPMKIGIGVGALIVLVVLVIILMKRKIQSNY